MDMELNGLRALVTGGSDGIGLETARLLVGEGTKVAVASREPEVGAEAIGATPIAVDLAEAAAGERAVAAAVDALGGLDLLVNNVGVARIAGFEQLTEDDLQQSWELNVMSYVRCIRAALPALRESRAPAIVNVPGSPQLRIPPLRMRPGPPPEGPGKTKVAAVDPSFSRSSVLVVNVSESPGKVATRTPVGFRTRVLLGLPVLFKALPTCVPLKIAVQVFPDAGGPTKGPDPTPAPLFVCQMATFQPAVPPPCVLVVTRFTEAAGLALTWPELAVSPPALGRNPVLVRA